MTADLKIVPNATCTFCGYVCDDMELTVEGHKFKGIDVELKGYNRKTVSKE